MDGPGGYHTKSSRERQVSHEITYRRNLQFGTNEPVNETKTDEQTETTDLRLQGLGKEGGWKSELGLAAQTIIYRMDNKQGPPTWLSGKASPANAGDTRESTLFSGSGRSLGGGNGSLFHYSGLENPLDRAARRATVHAVTKRRK